MKVKANTTDRYVLSAKLRTRPVNITMMYGTGEVLNLSGKDVEYIIPADEVNPQRTAIARGATQADLEAIYNIESTNGTINPRVILNPLYKGESVKETLLSSLDKNAKK